VSEDWRVTVDLTDESTRGRVLSALEVAERDEGAATGAGRIAVSGGDGHIFLYADTAAGAHEGERTLALVLGRLGLTATTRLERWHPAEDAWEDADVPLPSTPAALEAERQRLEQAEAQESKASGLAAWELRIELPSHAEALQFARRLAGEGYTHVVRRWRYLLVGTVDSDDANALAARLRGELPPGSTIHVEPAGGAVWQLMPENPFAVFGGLGG
jgi:hypothetical protein